MCYYIVKEIALMRQERMVYVLDVQKLKGKIVEKGKSVEKVSDEIGIHPSTFYRKLKENSFEICEADKLVEALDLTGAEATAIFFSQVVA